MFEGVWRNGICFGLTCVSEILVKMMLLFKRWVHRVHIVLLYFSINYALCLLSVSPSCVNRNWTISILCDFVLVACLGLYRGVEGAEEVSQTAV